MTCCSPRDDTDFELWFKLDGWTSLRPMFVCLAEDCWCWFDFAGIGATCWLAPSIGSADCIIDSEGIFCWLSEWSNVNDGTSSRMNTIEAPSVKHSKVVVDTFQIVTAVSPVESGCVVIQEIGNVSCSVVKTWCCANSGISSLVNTGENPSASSSSVVAGLPGGEKNWLAEFTSGSLLTTCLLNRFSVDSLSCSSFISKHSKLLSSFFLFSCEELERRELVFSIFFPSVSQTSISSRIFVLCFPISAWTSGWSRWAEKIRCKLASWSCSIV